MQPPAQPARRPSVRPHAGCERVRKQFFERFQVLVVESRVRQKVLVSLESDLVGYHAEIVVRHEKEQSQATAQNPKIALWPDGQRITKGLPTLPRCPWDLLLLDKP